MKPQLTYYKIDSAYKPSTAVIRYLQPAMLRICVSIILRTYLQFKICFFEGMYTITQSCRYCLMQIHYMQTIFWGLNLLH